MGGNQTSRKQKSAVEDDFYLKQAEILSKIAKEADLYRMEFTLDTVKKSSEKKKANQKGAMKGNASTKRGYKGSDSKSNRNSFQRATTEKKKEDNFSNFIKNQKTMHTYLKGLDGNIQTKKKELNISLLKTEIEVKPDSY